MASAPRKTRKDFWKMITVIKDKTSCWNWQGRKDRYGYGKWRVKFKGNPFELIAHRTAFIILNGHTDLLVLHKCDNRKCCRPSHLYAGTQADNVRDMVERRRWYGARKIHQLW